MEFRARRWRRLLNLIDHLPRTSFLAEAMADDEEAAAQWLAHQEAGGELAARRERWSEWTAERDALERIADALSVLIGVTVNVHGGKATRTKPGPRPTGAVDRLRERQRLNADRALKARLGFGPPPPA